MKTINNKRHIGIDADGLWYPIDEDRKSIVLNGTEYVLPDEVWEFLLIIDSEREYWKAKNSELEGYLK